LKSAISKRSLALVPFLKTQKHVILLTGTPALAKPKELFNMLSIIRPDVFFSFKTFGNRYCDPKKSRFKEGNI
jgi:SWI/SNF-related matrix-associated actin-dependent regulator 1 of chromatin subfamily A